MNHAKWIEHFTRNKQNRPEPDWAAPNNVPPDMLVPMLRSIEQFRLGDGGGPASLIAFDRENFRSRADEMRVIVDLWFAEEAEHARLLGCAVKRFGGRIITSHWSFTAFCLCRRVLGVRFELQVLTLTELVSAAYCRKHATPATTRAAQWQPAHRTARVAGVAGGKSFSWQPAFVDFPAIHRFTEFAGGICPRRRVARKFLRSGFSRHSHPV